MSDSTAKTSSTDKAADTSKASSTDKDTTKDGPKTADAPAADGDPKLVSAEPGSEQYTKTGDSAAVDTHGSPVGYAPYSPRSADEENLENPVSEEDPNFVEAARKIAPERVPESRGAADIEPKQE